MTTDRAARGQHRSHRQDAAARSRRARPRRGSRATTRPSATASPKLDPTGRGLAAGRRRRWTSATRGVRSKAIRAPRCLRVLAGASPHGRGTTQPPRRTNPSGREASRAAWPPAPTRRHAPCATDRSPATRNNEAADALEQAEDALREIGDRARRRTTSGDAGRSSEADRTEAWRHSQRSARSQPATRSETAMEQANEGRGELHSRALDAASRSLHPRAQQTPAKQVRQAEHANRATCPKPRPTPPSSAIEQAQHVDAERRAVSCRTGKPSQASRSQSNAADALERAQQTDPTQPPAQRSRTESGCARSPNNRSELEEDIIQLAKLAEERQNRRAQKRARGSQQKPPQRAAEAARAWQHRPGRPRAGDGRAAARGREAKNSSSERDRYMDLRQEELLFRIGNELEQFLEAQVPLTQQTQAAAKQLEEQWTTEPPSPPEAQPDRRERERADRPDGVHPAGARRRGRARVLARVAGQRRGPSSRSPSASAVVVPIRARSRSLLQQDVEERARQADRGPEAQEQSAPRRGTPEPTAAATATRREPVRA